MEINEKNVLIVFYFVCVVEIINIKIAKYFPPTKTKDYVIVSDRH